MFLNTVTATISVGTTPMKVTVSPNGKTIYVSNSGSNTVSVINASNNTIKTINKKPSS